MQNRTVESGVQLFSRMNSHTTGNLNGINSKLFPEGGPFGNQVIEVVFDQNTDYDFFLDLIVRAILPPKLSKEFKGAQVIFLNTDFQINLFKIIKFIEHKLTFFKVKNEMKNSLVEESLKNLIILDCFSCEQLEITFYNLERIINNCSNPGLILYDNILSQYWCTKFKNFKLSFDEHCIKTLDLLHNQIKHLNLVLMYGRPGLGNSKKRASQINYCIEIIKNGDESLAKVYNLEKDSSLLVPFKSNVSIAFTKLLTKN